MMKHFFAVFCLLFAGKVLHAQQPVVFEKTLPNGFTIYVMENHDQPRVFGAVAVRAGSKNDPADATGMAHYLEHMLFKGTTEMGTTDYAQEKIWLDSITHYYDVLGGTADEARRQAIQLKINNLSIKAAEFAIPNEIDRMLAEIGGTGVNAFTTVESTVYHNSFPANQLERWMEIYSHRFQHPVFRLFQSELETVYEEKNRKMDDMGSSIFEYYLRHFFKKHPYGQQTTIGETEHLKNPSLKKMYTYFETYYVPNNMCLVIAGDVDHADVFALAEKKFGVMTYKEVPGFIPPVEEPFKGKEVLRIRRTPVKAGVIGYRLPESTSPDIPALNVVSDLLSNSSASGRIDKVVNNNKLFFGGLEYMSYNDGGTAFLFFVPKIVGQSLGKAEKLMLACVEDIKAGRFTDEELTAVKTNRMKLFEEFNESGYQAALNLVNAYIEGISPAAYFGKIEKIKAISREDVMAAAKKYFGDNSLAMYSRMGFPKKDKLKKPPFKPVIPKSDVKSAYYTNWEKIPKKMAVPRFVDMQKDIDSLNAGTNFTIYKNKNPFNNIVSMNLLFGTGKHYDPILEYTGFYLLNCGTAKQEVNVFNARMYALGCTFQIEVSAHQFALKLNFPEENLREVLAMIKELMTEPLAGKAAQKKVVRETKMDFRVNGQSPEYYADALSAYAVYGKNSSYLDKMGVNEFKRKNSDEIIASVGRVWNASLRVYYTGNIPNEKLQALFKENGFNVSRANPQPIYVAEKTAPAGNTVYLLNMRKARQSQIDMLKIGSPYRKEDAPRINAFNKYFGGDMSSLMFQEIREFRSLAYATYGSYGIPLLNGHKSLFTAYAGTQSDKTNECIEVMYNLVNNMPEYPDRLPAIKSALLEMASASRPAFRNIIGSVESWKRKGYDSDPAKYMLLQYPLLTFKDIQDFYAEHVKPKPTMVCVTGKLKTFNSGALKKYGTVKKVKKKKLVKK